MLRNTRDLRGFVIQALDGELGRIDQFYFDDVTWTVRYLVVETGDFHDGRRVLISPIAILHLDWQARRLDLALTIKQVTDSPAIDPSRSVFRQNEAAYLGQDLPIPDSSQETLAKRLEREASGSHLRSTLSVNGYSIRATDCEFGHLDGFIVEDESWSIRYIEVATRNWCEGKRVLILTAWIKDVSWNDITISINLSAEAITNAPEYVEDMPISREYEDQLYRHYGQPPYWLHETAETHSLVRA